MNAYELLDLSALCNTGPEIVGPDRDPAVGEQTFHGLPFRIGSDKGAPCFLGFGASSPLYTEPVSIPIGKAARRLIFAHAQAESHLEEGQPVGTTIARYTFV